MGPKLAALEQRAGQGRADVPRVGRAGGKRGQLGADFAQEGRQPDLRKEIREARADVGVGGNERLLRLKDIRPALQQRAGQTGRNFHRKRRQVRQRPARDRAGIAAEQEVDLVLGRRDLQFELRNARGGIRHRGGGAVGFELGGDAVDPPVVENPVAAGVGVGGGALDRQLLVQVEQIEIGGGDIADQRDRHAAAGFVRGEVLGASGLGQAADASPEINFPHGVQVDLRGACRGAVLSGRRVEQRRSSRARHRRRSRFAERAGRARP